MSVDFQSNLRKQIRKLPKFVKFVKFVKIIQFYSIVSLDRKRRGLLGAAREAAEVEVRGHHHAEAPRKPGHSSRSKVGQAQRTQMDREYV